jgi:hypothetical protein
LIAYIDAQINGFIDINLHLAELEDLRLNPLLFAPSGDEFRVSIALSLGIEEAPPPPYPSIVKVFPAPV